MAFASDQAPAAKPSLYALISLARHVQRVRQVLKARVQAHKAPVANDHPEHFVHLASTHGNSINSIIKSLKRRHTRPPSLPPGDRSALGKELGLLHDLDHHTEKSSYRPLVEIAADESLFLGHKIRYSRPTNLAGACHVFDLSTILLARLEQMQVGEYEAGLKNYPLYHPRLRSIQDEKIIANLEHLLRCLQQDAWDALVQFFQRIVDADSAHWDQYWKQTRQLDDGWFAEWPNGRHPLSTTWPWNIKPSLVVLWGVCWMFMYPGRGWSQLSNSAHSPYGHSQVGNTTAATATASATAWQAAGQVRVPGLLPGVGGAFSLSQSQSSLSPATLSDHSPSHAHAHVHAHTQFARPHQAGLAESVVDCAVPLHFRPSANANDTFAAPYSLDGPGVPVAYNPALTDSSWATLTTLSSDDLQQQAWYLNIDESQQSYAPSTQEAFIAPPERHFRGSQVPHASGHLQVSTSYTPQATPAAHQGGSAYLGSELVASMHGTEEYPSPHSEHSGRVRSQGPSGGPSPNSDRTRRASSMSGSSPRLGVSPTQIRTGEPPKDEAGNMYCSHEGCLDERKIFTRKCEWSKHMDKHDRPYKCPVAGCEKLAGFTYAGGLLRHKREVHNMDGGPKASRMCPYSDCKRSTGSAFSRKENLQEHLRRVHRGVGDQLAKVETGQQPPEGLGGSRKRRRVTHEDDFDDDSDEDTEELSEPVKRMKQEIVELQQTVERLERVVESLVRSQQRSS